MGFLEAGTPLSWPDSLKWAAYGAFPNSGEVSFCPRSINAPLRVRRRLRSASCHPQPALLIVILHLMHPYPPPSSQSASMASSSLFTPTTASRIEGTTCSNGAMRCVFPPADVLPRRLKNGRGEIHGIVHPAQCRGICRPLTHWRVALIQSNAWCELGGRGLMANRLL